MSAHNPIASLPLFAPPMTSAEHGRAGAADAHQHLTDHAPGWVLEALGDALLALRGQSFTTDDVRRLAGPTVDAWLTDANVPERRNCFSGWFTARAAKLVRVGSVRSSRADARGRYVSVWRFPVAESAA